MQGRVTARSPAKLNLHLEIQSKRDDGYHSIISIFQMIGFYDEMQCCSLKDENVCRITGMPDIPMEDNTIFKAVSAFRKYTGINGGVRFSVKKNIPPQAGLGGGSGNAGYALRMLNHLFQTGLSTRELRVLGAEIGSDVPFFCGEPCALVTGRGERIQPIEGRNDLWGVLIVPGFGVNTRKAYAEFDKHGSKRESVPPETLVSHYLESAPSVWRFFNSFEAVLAEVYPDLRAVLGMLKGLGSDFTAMSGSGSSCFGIFSGKKDAEHALTVCKESYKSWVFNLLAKSPDTVLQ